ncbi:MAG: hypothetical protein NC081_06700 [Roseburia sp.]|nr:hypothetical protein [Roseburia sp.]
MRKYSFPVPSCRACGFHRQYDTQCVCDGFLGPEQRAFKPNDPAKYPPQWCPRRHIPAICHIYTFKDELSASCDQYWRNVNDFTRERYVSPDPNRYKLSVTFELPAKMSARKFYIDFHANPANNVLSGLDLPVGSVIQVDDGLLPYCFYYFSRDLLIPIKSFYPN